MEFVKTGLDNKVNMDLGLKIEKNDGYNRKFVITMFVITKLVALY
jgi:hypothetical protein